MASQTQTTIRHNVFPGMQYRDAVAALDWLERAFDFRPQLVVPGQGGRSIAHAQMRAGENGGIIMLGSTRDGEDGQAYRRPEQAGGVTHAIYIVIDDIDAHYARAKAAGAVIVSELKDTDYGSRDYSARDLEGFLWNFGTYDPESAPSITAAAAITPQA